MPPGPKRKLITTKNTSLEGKEMIRHNSEILCSLVEVNVNYVNKEWSNWFRGRHILVRYEDTAKDLVNTVFKMYNFTGLPMVTSITNWIREGIQPPSVRNRNPSFTISNDNSKGIKKWRFRLHTSQVSEFEERCWPLMYMMGHISLMALIVFFMIPVKSCGLTRSHSLLFAKTGKLRHSFTSEKVKAKCITGNH